MHPEHRPLSQYRQWLDHLRKFCQLFIDHLIEEGSKESVGRKAEAERLANDPKFAEIATQDRTRKTLLTGKNQGRLAPQKNNEGSFFRREPADRAVKAKLPITPFFDRFDDR